MAKWCYSASILKNIFLEGMFYPSIRHLYSLCCGGLLYVGPEAFSRDPRGKERVHPAWGVPKDLYSHTCTIHHGQFSKRSVEEPGEPIITIDELCQNASLKLIVIWTSLGKSQLHTNTVTKKSRCTRQNT